MQDFITVRCDGCGEVRYDVRRWLIGATHRVLGVICGHFREAEAVRHA